MSGDLPWTAAVALEHHRNGMTIEDWKAAVGDRLTPQAFAKAVDALRNRHIVYRAMLGGFFRHVEAP